MSTCGSRPANHELFAGRLKLSMPSSTPLFNPHQSPAKSWSAVITACTGGGNEAMRALPAPLVIIHQPPVITASPANRA
ncbi:MAG: hypothetical protein U0694_02620 [Anaerolineae bacterium]